MPRPTQQSNIQQKKPVKQDPKAMVFELANDIRSLNSSVMLISQKMRHIIRNEKILGRNLVVLYKKIKSGEAVAGKNVVPADLEKRLSEIEAKLQEVSEKTSTAISEVATLKNSMVTDDQLKELKYVIDAINPLEYVTLEQAKQMIEERINAQQQKKPPPKK